MRLISFRGRQSDKRSNGLPIVARESGPERQPLGRFSFQQIHSYSGFANISAITKDGTYSQRPHCPIGSAHS